MRKKYTIIWLVTTSFHCIWGQIATSDIFTQLLRWRNAFEVGTYKFFLNVNNYHHSYLLQYLRIA